MMKKVISVLAVLLAIVATSTAQTKSETKFKLDGRANVNGHIIDGSTTENMPQVTIQLFQIPDSTFLYGTITDNEGWFNIKKVPVGEYFLKYSFVGYQPQTFDLKIIKEDRERALGVFKMYDESIMLSEAVIEESLPPTQGGMLSSRRS